MNTTPFSRLTVFVIDEMGGVSKGQNVSEGRGVSWGFTLTSEFRHLICIGFKLKVERYKN